MQDLLVPMLISEGTESLASTVRVSLGTPIKPMLAKYVPLSHHLLSVYLVSVIAMLYFSFQGPYLLTNDWTTWQDH